MSCSSPTPSSILSPGELSTTPILNATRQHTHAPDWSDTNWQKKPYVEVISPNVVDHYPHLIGQLGHVLVGNERIQLVAAGISLSASTERWQPLVLGVFTRANENAPWSQMRTAGSLWIGGSSHQSLSHEGPGYIATDIKYKKTESERAIATFEITYESTTPPYQKLSVQIKLRAGDRSIKIAISPHTKKRKKSSTNLLTIRHLSKSIASFFRNASMDQTAAKSFGSIHLSEKERFFFNINQPLWGQTSPKEPGQTLWRVEFLNKSSPIKISLGWSNPLVDSTIESTPSSTSCKITSAETEICQPQGGSSSRAITLVLEEEKVPLTKDLAILSKNINKDNNKKASHFEIVSVLNSSSKIINASIVSSGSQTKILVPSSEKFWLSRLGSSKKIEFSNSQNETLIFLPTRVSEGSALNKNKLPSIQLEWSKIKAKMQPLETDVLNITDPHSGISLRLAGRDSTTLKKEWQNWLLKRQKRKPFLEIVSSFASTQKPALRISLVCPPLGIQVSMLHRWIDRTKINEIEARNCSTYSHRKQLLPELMSLVRNDPKIILKPKVLFPTTKPQITPPNKIDWSKPIARGLLR